MWDGGTTATLAMLAGLIPFALLVLTAGLGGGDMKLMAAIGAWSAMWQVVLATTVYALVVAVVMAVVVMVRRGVVKQTLSRIVGAAMLSRSGVKAELPNDGPKVPFAAAVAVGFAVAGAEQMLGVVTPWESWGAVARAWHLCTRSLPAEARRCTTGLTVGPGRPSVTEY